jgi:N utilization substance protein B
MKLTRRNAREWAVQMLCSADLNPAADLQETISEFWGSLAECQPSSALRQFAEDRVKGVHGDLAAIDGELTELLDNWDLYRLGTVERAVLRMGIWELKESDVPAAVAINEAVDLVNWFSTPKSRMLVNGVLDRYAKSRG